MSGWDVLLWAGMFLFYGVCIMLEGPFQSQFVCALDSLLPSMVSLLAPEGLSLKPSPYSLDLAPWLILQCIGLTCPSEPWALRPLSAESFCVFFSHPGSLALQGKWLYLAWRCAGQNTVFTEMEKYDGPWGKECTEYHMYLQTISFQTDLGTVHCTWNLCLTLAIFSKWLIDFGGERKAS